MRFFAVSLILALGACTPLAMPPSDAGPVAMQPQDMPPVTRDQAMRNFATAVRRVEPVAEDLCRRRSAASVNCDFRIVVDNRPNVPPNAYQTLDASGRPILAFTVPLIADARNVDEIAFVMAHEAAHHIEGHITRQTSNAQVGALLLGGLASALGAGDQATLEVASRIGANVGARSYSKDFELEADATGTRIAAAAGFDPLRGAQFFFRIPDPGDRFLGTHPPNADRLRTVERVAAGL
ncbi:MAG: M48 family metallopeptidase [Yoonia sp.]|uniref:M48 family metallopeptidase n=1 Tax=Yoonia sp. TaxID=2212373 RepID=UPI003EF8F1D7